MTLDKLKQLAIAAKAQGNVVVLDAPELLKVLDRIEQLERENAELRKDANRYRWLAWRSDTNPIMPYDHKADRFYFGHACDAAIDEAMKS